MASQPLANSKEPYRDTVLAGKPLFLDAAKTMPLTDPAQCLNEVKTAAKLANVGKALRTTIANPKKCTDALVVSLTSTCANTIDGLVNPTGTGGCLVTDGNAAADALLDAAY